MANRYLKPLQGCLEGGIVKLYGHVITSTSGTISSSDCKGFSVAKTATETGRYTITLEDGYTSLRAASITVIGADDAAYTASKGLQAMLRNVDVSGSTKTLYVQFVDATDAGQADAELENGAEFLIELTLKNTATY